MLFVKKIVHGMWMFKYQYIKSIFCKETDIMKVDLFENDITNLDVMNQCAFKKCVGFVVK